MQKETNETLKKLKSEIQTYIDYQDWYHQAKKDIKSQKSIHRIEYVDVASRNSLPLSFQNLLMLWQK